MRHLFLSLPLFPWSARGCPLMVKLVAGVPVHLNAWVEGLARVTCAKTGYVTSGKIAKVFPGILHSNAGVERAALSPEILRLIELNKTCLQLSPRPLSHSWTKVEKVQWHGKEWAQHRGKSGHNGLFLMHLGPGTQSSWWPDQCHSHYRRGKLFSLS